MDAEGVSLAGPVDCTLKHIQNPTTHPPLLPPTPIIQVIMFSYLDYGKTLQMDRPASPYAPL